MLGLLGRWVQVLRPLLELLAVGVEVIEEPGQVGLDVHIVLLGRPDHTQQDGPPMCPRDASGEL